MELWLTKARSRSLITLAVTGAVAVTAFLSCLFLLYSLANDAPWVSWWPHISLPDLLRFIKSLGYWGVGVSVGLMILHSFVPIPAEFVAVANGLVYGAVWGTVITWVGAMLGAYLAFALARKYGQPFVRRLLTEKKSKVVENWVARHGTGALFISRFIPIISFNLINYAAGLSPISWWTFSWTTGLGILPMTVLMVVMGDRFYTLSWSAWLLVLCGGLSLWLALRRLTRHPRFTGPKGKSRKLQD